MSKITKVTQSPQFHRLETADGSLVSQHTNEFEVVQKLATMPPGEYTLRMASVKFTVEAEAAAPVPAPPAPVPAPPAPVPPPPAPTPPAPAPSAFAWVVGQHATNTPPPMPKPAKGVVFSDAVYGVPMVRVTDHGPEAPNGFARNDYSRRDPFNCDGTLQLVYALDAYWHLYDRETCEYRGVALGSGIGSDCEPHWHPTNPKLIRRFANYGGDAAIWETNVETGVHTKLATVITGYDNVWTKAEGSPSADHRYWAFMCENGWDTKLVICYDLVDMRIVGQMSMTADPDHVSMSPCGKRVVVSFYGNGWGVRAYTRDFSSFTQIDDAYGEHSDICLLPDGNSAYVSVEYQSNSGEFYYTPLETGVRVPLFNTYPGGSALHVSGKCYGKPGWVLVSCYGGGTDNWFDNKIFLVHLLTGEIRNVGFHRAGIPDTGAYFFEPHASISRDGRFAAFSSSWGSLQQADIEAYQIRLPAF